MPSTRGAWKAWGPQIWPGLPRLPLPLALRWLLPSCQLYPHIPDRTGGPACSTVGASLPLTWGADRASRKGWRWRAGIPAGEGQPPAFGEPLRPLCPVPPALPWDLDSPHPSLQAHTSPLFVTHIPEDCPGNK